MGIYRNLLRYTWQNSKNIIYNLINSHVFLGAYLQNRLAGYVIYSAKGKRLKQIAIDKNSEGER